MTTQNLGTGTSRRNLFVGATALAAFSSTAFASSPAHPDAELMAACAEHSECNRQFNLLHDGPDASDDCEDEQSRRFVSRMNILEERIADLRATTAAGIVARAVCLHVDAGHFDFTFDDPTQGCGLMLACLMRDAVGLAGSV